MIRMSRTSRRGRADLHLLPPAALVKTGPVDHADWNFRGPLGAIQRVRFRMVLRLLTNHPIEDLLEVGYGSGVFAPELSRHCDRYHGVDVHAKDGEVSLALRRQGISAMLRRGSVTDIPFPADSFDCVVGVSVLEFVDDHDAACSEISRVLKADGRLIIVTPGSSRLLDLALTLLTRESPKKDFGDRRQRVVPALQKHFMVLRVLDFPFFAVGNTYAYRALACKRRRP